MFRLKKLEIQGFKSFVEKTSLTLPSRITAIVGPNGSGKSNICDAVQWVLGEQSARVLRGTTMEDVIFNGSARRRPLGLAEVSLTLEARGDQWAETGGEVVITRRVARDGDSDYILNGKRSRLKDVQEVLYGTGLGVRAYSIIEQQKVDLILSTKPQDRRRLIEEAAGVSKYKIRKRQAEVKLEETRANLLRLSDIVSEIERTCSSLKRQAGRASKYRTEAQTLEALKKRLFRMRADRLQIAVAEGEVALAAAVDAEAQALAALGKAEAELAQAQHLADEEERRSREAQTASARAREALLSAEAAVAASSREAEEVEARKDLLGQARREAEADHLRSAEEAGRADKVRAEVEVELLAAEERVRATSAALAQAVARENEEGARLQAARRELLTAGARAADAANREREASQLQDRLTFALGKLEERKAKSDEAVTAREEAVEKAREIEETAAATIAEARQRLEETGLGRKAAEEKLSSLKTDREDAIRRYHALDRRIAALETTLHEREAGGQAARKALAAGGVHTDSVLADHFEAREGFEKALDAAMGAALESPVLKDRSQVDAALAAVRAAKLGTARFVYAAPEAPASSPARPDDPRVLASSHELLTPRKGDEELAGSFALPDALVVATVDEALSLAPRHPERTIATQDGVVLRGSILEAAGTEMPGEGLFTVRRDLKGLTTEREALRETLSTFEGEIEATAVRGRELAAALDQELAATRRAEREHGEAAARLRGAREELVRAEREAGVLFQEEEILRGDLAEAIGTRESLVGVAAQKQEEVTILERTIGELEVTAQTTRTARLSAGEADATAKNARDILKERRRAAAETYETHRSRAENAARRLSEVSDGLLGLDGRKEQALTTGEQARLRREAAAEKLAEVEELRAAADVRARESRQTRDQGDRAAHAARETLDTTRRTRFEAELLLERRKGDNDHLGEQCRNEFGVAPTELPPIAEPAAEVEGEDAPPPVPGAGLDEAALAETVVQKTVALERLGPVNHAAFEEFEVESKRLQELSTQKLDLEKALEQILETIATINATSSERFQEAFANINVNFSKVFQQLFRGGTATLHLLDENDPLDSGIEIMAQPPGKRNQTIGLLSGGEKALTAVALLVAIFRYRPSPFCIMDEVDAPLDEANIDRFTALLSELSEETQFVLITHSKRTMETAQALYGVTQEEPGVSKLVSVRFD